MLPSSHLVVWLIVLDPAPDTEHSGEQTNFSGLAYITPDHREETTLLESHSEEEKRVF